MPNTNSRGLAINGGRRIFAFHGRAEAWRPAKGGRTPSGDGFVVHCIPGRFVATGRTLDDAVKSLINILDATMVSSNTDRDEWWHGAINAMNATDRDLFRGIVVDAAKTGQVGFFGDDSGDMFMLRADDGDTVGESCNHNETVGAY